MSSRINPFIFLLTVLGVYGLARHYTQKVDGFRIVPPPRPEYPLPESPPDVEFQPNVDLQLARLQARPVVLVFWSPDPDSLKWMPTFNRMHRAYSRLGLELTGIYKLPETGQSKELIESIFRRHRIAWKQIIGNYSAETWFNRWGIKSFPSVVILNSQGKVSWKGMPDEMLEDLVAQAVGARWSSRDSAAIVPLFNGRVVYAGRAISDITTETPQFMIHDLAIRPDDEVKFNVDYDARTGQFTAHYIPEGTYRLEIRIGQFCANPETAFVSFPGQTFGISGATMNNPEEFSVQRYIRLREPVDNGKELPWPPERPVHFSPVRFVWDPVPEATVYSYVLHWRPVGEVANPWELAVSGNTVDPRIELEVQPGCEYRFALSGRGKDGRPAAHLSLWRQASLPEDSYHFSAATEAERGE